MLTPGEAAECVLSNADRLIIPGNVHALGR